MTQMSSGVPVAARIVGAKTMGGEQVLLTVHPAMFRNRPLLFILTVWTVIIPLIWWLRCKATTLSITTGRTVLREGLLAKRTNEVRHSDTRNIQVNQGFLQRIFGVGNIGVSSAGQSGVEIEVSGVPSPQKIADLIRRNQG